MFIKIPFESEIEFKTNISEITKMSLEHDFNVNDGVVLGNFYVSGEYRVHEVSVNKEPFKYTLPFTVELRDDIKKDTIEFNIEDFSYDIIKNNTLKVNIEYSLTGEIEEKEETVYERVDEKELESELTFIDEFLDKEEKENTEEKECIEEEKEEIETNEEEDRVEEKKEKEEEIFKEEEKEEKVEVEKIVEDKKEEDKSDLEEERLNEEEEKTIMETIKDSDDTFVTYHVHIVKESESIDTISHVYGVPSSLISEYNNCDSISIGDKLLIPKADE